MAIAKLLKRQPAILVRWFSVDGAREIRPFGCVSKAGAYARQCVGDAPMVGALYAVSRDGCSTVEVLNCSLRDLFPAEV